jgi:hypothetical protein
MKTINLHNIMNKLYIINYYMKGLVENENKSYDYNSDFEVTKQLIYKGEFIIKFNKINGYFYCNFLKLTSLEGCPKEVNGWFSCSYNELTSLKYCPKQINGDFYCTRNNLISLEDSPEIINGTFDCSYNKLTNLNGCPKEVNGYFDCSYNYKKFTVKEVKFFCNVKS